MTGDLGYFLSKERPNEGRIQLKFQLSEEFLDAVSGVFAAQFDIVLQRALERNNLAAARCLLGGRRLTKDEDVDACFAGARRLIERTLEPIKALAVKAESSKVDVRAAMVVCSKDSINTLLSLLPSEFIELQREYYGYLFALSREIYRDGSGIEEALKIIELAAPIALVCVDVNDGLIDAKKQLNGLLAKEKEKEVHLTFGAKKLDITKTGVEYGGIRIGAEEVRALRWGIVFVSNSPRTAEFSIGISNLYGREIIVSWRSSDIEAQRKNWEHIINGVFEYLFDSAYESFKASMSKAGQITLGGVDMNSSGATFMYDGWLSKKSHFAPWSHIRHEIDNGELVLQAETERKAIARISLASNWNAVVLKYYLKQLEG
jgi:hypothetical protein